MNRPKLSIIGMGRISPYHVRAALANSDGVELVAVCDISTEKLDRSLEQAELLETVSAYTDYNAMLKESAPQIVAIATPSGTHGQIASDCLDFGCHVILEKPMAMSMQEMRSIAEKAEQRGLVVGVCHQNRFNGAVQQLMSAIDKGSFGRLSHCTIQVRWNRGREYYSEADWRGKWESDGGCLMNQCIHGIDLLCAVLGEIEEVFAYTANRQHPYIEGEDLGLAVVRARSGAYGLIEGTVNVYPSNLEETLCVFGEKGTAKLGGKSLNKVEHWEFEGAEAMEQPRTQELPPDIYGFGHGRLYADVLRAIETGSAPLVGAAEGMQATQLVLAIYKSQKTGLPVRLPLREFGSADMAGSL